MSHKKLRQGIIETCREMNRSGLNQGTSGNVSHRIEGGLLITPTSLPYDRMKPDDIIEMKFDGSYEGRHRPSSEWRFHRDLQQKRPEINVVLHTHSVYCTTLATHERGIPAFHYMVAVAGGTDVRCSPYACFGTKELSEVAFEALKDRTACLLGHHGLLVLADTFEKALWRAVEIETLAKMYVHALAIGEPPRLTEKEMAQVIEQMRRMSYGQAPDLDRVGDTPKPQAIAPAPEAERPVAKSVATPITVPAPTAAPAKKAPARKTSAAPVAKASRAGSESKAPVAKPESTAEATEKSFKSLAKAALSRRQ